MPLPTRTESQRPSRWKRWTALAVLAALGAGGVAVQRGWLSVPDRFNPWAPLDVMAPPDWLTSFRLWRTRADPALCLQALASTGMQYDPLPDRVTGPGCGFENAVLLRTAPVRFGAPLSLSCPMALSFFMWERHALQPAAQARFGEKVAAVQHLGSYACRNINRGEGAASDAPRSQHATANALDIAAITLADGRRISVAQDWAPTLPGARADDAAGLLRDLHSGACRYFPGVLGPDYNAVHRDHFHLETGGYRMCR